MANFRTIRKRVFLGCQGESERSYATLLHRLVERTHKLHIDAVLLSPGAGDPLATVQRAIEICKKKESSFGRYEAKAILLDQDQVGLCPDRDNKVTPLAIENAFKLIWQKPCHEGFLLRHFPACRTHQPLTAKEALRRLLRCWPEYQKALPANALEARITYGMVLAACDVELELNDFLREIGYF